VSGGFGPCPGESSGSCPPAYLRGAGKVAEIRGHQHHDIFWDPRDESSVFSYLSLAHLNLYPNPPRP
jgi:hypothetical protein